MIPLGQTILEAHGSAFDKDKVIRLSHNPDRPISLRKRELYIVDGIEVPPDFWGYLSFDRPRPPVANKKERWFVVSKDLAYLRDGDVVRLSSDLKRIRVLFRVGAVQNSLLLTERCNHYCLMCSQPPKTQDDSYLIENIKDVLRLASRDCEEIGFTGGEPTLLGDQFIELVRLADSYLPETALHVLSNGRAFENRNFSRQLGEVGHHDIMLGIPIYSDVPEIHNYVVQAENALEGTVRGILNLNRYGVPVEVRVVLHRVTVNRLINLAEFIARNLPFVAHVAFMGLEMTGFARANKRLLWVEPDDYANELREATLFLTKRKIRTSIYNLQHCLMPRDIWPYMRKSISDWKNEYEPECEQCGVRDLCGGFFSSFIHQKPKNIRPVQIDII
ncbi:His-Xaa-Ser system radical SAM maturase HxsC [Woeseiaceae bacterium]|nr:His-Xaa-Ser system radical SAM maturase HxsC [Woeseiaceae bacterium]